MPTASDLVTDLPADFEVFGQAVATSMADLLGGTTGQILAKASNTNMDFTWITNDVGDITAVTVTSPITGGGTSGSVGIAIQDASTSQRGSVQLSDSTSTTSSILAATPTAVKSAYDLADSAIAKSTVTTAGDIIYRNATVPVRLGIGTANQVLRVNSGATAPEWATNTAGMTLISTTSLSGSSTAISSIPATYKNLQLVIRSAESNATANIMSFTVNSVVSYDYITHYGNNSSPTVNTSSGFSTTPVKLTGTNLRNSNSGSEFVINIYDYASTTSNKTGTISANYLIGTNYGELNTGGFAVGSTGAITSITLAIAGGSTFSAGTALLYGVN
jgi:hypothetical protein